MLWQGKQQHQDAERQDEEADDEEAAAPPRRVTRQSLGSAQDMTLSGGLPHPRSPIKASWTLVVG